MLTRAETIQRLKAAVALGRQPHYGYNDAELDHLYDALAAVEDLIKDLEKGD